MKKFKIVYNIERDSFEIYTCIGRCHEWYLLARSKCRSIDGGIDTSYIHYSIIKEIVELLLNGYEYDN